MVNNGRGSKKRKNHAQNADLVLPDAGSNKGSSMVYNEKGSKKCRAYEEESAHLVLPNRSCHAQNLAAEIDIYIVYYIGR